MKGRFYNRLLYEKDLAFCEIMQELEKNPHVLLLFEPEKEKVCLQKSDESHIGYARHYVKFLYSGYVFYVQSTDFYPFTDENHPGQFNFIAFERIGKTKVIQRSYNEKYENLESVLNWVKSPCRRIPGVFPKDMGLRVGEQQANAIEFAVRRIGGAREKAVLDASPVFLRSETWNTEHQVVRVIAGLGDYSGHWNGFNFDLVTKMICG